MMIPIFMLGIFSASMILLMVFYNFRKNIWEQKLQRKEKEHEQFVLQRILETQEEERKRFAADLHDALSGEIIGLKYAVFGLKLSKEEEDNLEDIFQRVSSRIREISNNMMPPILEDFGLKATLEELCSYFNREGSPQVEYEWIGKDWDCDLNMALHIYRIVKELLTNAIKHANASMINLSVIHVNKKFILEVSDNGIGVDPRTIAKPKEGKKNGNGMRNIHNRAKFIGATIDFTPKKNIGLTVKLIIDNTKNT